MARRPRFRGLIAKTLALFVVIAAGVGIVTFWQNREKNPESDDATIDADVRRLMGGDAADLVFTDPPTTWTTRATRRSA